MAPPKLPKGQPYTRRRADCAVLNITLDAEAAAILRKYCPPETRGTGKFLARLLYEHDARQQVAAVLATSLESHDI